MAEEQALVANDPWEGFKLPFPVATLEDLGQRAYLTAEGVPEWIYARVHSFLGAASEPGRMLRLNKGKILEDFSALQVPQSQLHFRGVEGQGQVAEPEGDQEGQSPWKDHTIESAGFLAVLLWTTRNRSAKQFVKAKALSLILSLVEKAFSMADLQRPLPVMLHTPEGTLASQEIRFTPQALCTTWGGFLRKSPGAVALWTRLGQRCWMNRCIASSIDYASFLDIWFFMVYLWCHPKKKQLGQTLYTCLCKLVLPELVCASAAWLDALARSLSQAPLKALPILKTKAGNASKVSDPVNKLLLLFKLRKEKLHRRRVASTHDELGGATNRMVIFENYLDCLLHMKALQKGFGGAKQLSVAWDPSTYGGKDILMSIVYSAHQDEAAYLMAQQLGHTVMSELDLSLVPFAKKKELKLLEGYKEVKGLSCALEGIGVSLMDFVVPPGLLWKPLSENQFRIRGSDGRYYIFDEHSSEQNPQIPLGLDLGCVPCLLSVSDQGPNNVAALNYLLFSSEALMLWAAWDPFHRVWNDIKLGLKRSSCKAWRNVLEMSLICNLNYGPFGSSAWHYKKKAKLQDFIACSSVDSPAFQKYKHLICQERRVLEPTTMAAQQGLLDSLSHMPSFATKGPLVKLMRWFSFFESMAFHHGQFFATKMVMEHQVSDEVESEKEVVVEKENVDHKQGLAELKKRKGTWKLAPELIKEASLCKKDCIVSVGKTAWQMFAHRAKFLLTPLQVLEHNISCAQHRFWLTEIEDMLKSCLYTPKNLQHLVPQWRMHDQALEWHIDLMEKLLETRTQSLVAFNCLPPALYSHALARSPVVARAASQLANSHFQILLQAEEALNFGSVIKPLDLLHWRWNPVIRSLHLAFEEDENMGKTCTEQSSATRLLKVLCQHLGDSRVIENVHQHGRDIFRSSKANSISNTAIMANALRSGVLQQRKVSCVTPQDAAVSKATGSHAGPWSREPVAHSLRTQGKKLPKELQKMMMPQHQDHTWPSPTPAALFPSAAATAWLFTYWPNCGTSWKGYGVNSAWLSFLARPGALLAQRSTGSLIKVLASAEFAFFGVLMKVENRPGDQRLYMCSTHRDSFQWHHICNLDDWLELQVEPCLANGNGTALPVAWKQGQQDQHPLTLEAAALIYGYNITFQQACALIRHLGGTVPPAPVSKATVLQILINMTVPETHVAAAKAASLPKEAALDDFDSDLSEVLSELAQDDNNHQDLKDLKAKKRTYKLRRKLAEKDTPVDGKKRRAKAKAKGKAKAKAKGRPKAKSSLLTSLAKRHQKMQNEKAELANHPEEQHLDSEKAHEKDVAGEPAPPGPSVPDAGPSVAAEPGAGHHDEMEEHGEPASSSSAPPVKRPRVAERRKSPEEILASLQPPGCKFGVSFKDHRWTSSWKYDHSELAAPFSQKSFSKSFALQKGWQECLREVHSHNWQKWNLLKMQYPLEPDQPEQVPGQVPQDIMEQLRPTVQSLGEVVRYGKKWIFAGAIGTNWLMACWSLGNERGIAGAHLNDAPLKFFESQHCTAFTCCLDFCQPKEHGLDWEKDGHQAAGKRGLGENTCCDNFFPCWGAAGGLLPHACTLSAGVAICFSCLILLYSGC